MPRSTLSRSALSLLPLALLVSAAAYRPSVNPAQVAGTISLVGKPNDHPEKGPGGALIFIGESKGSNESTGKPDFMDGAEVVSADTVSLVNGNGTHHGVLTMSKGSDKVAFKWGGQVTTRVDRDRRRLGKRDLRGPLHLPCCIRDPLEGRARQVALSWAGRHPPMSARA